jgi:hypothetical protein
VKKDKTTMVEVTEQLDLFGETYSSGVTINREMLAECFRTSLSKMSLDQVVALITNEYLEIIEYANLARGVRSASRKLSLLFNPHRLDVRTQTSVMSIYQAIREHPSFHNGLARATLVRIKDRTQLSELLYMSLQLNINGIQYVNEFPPHVARDWCNRYKLARHHRVLDPCAGWGGRMAGCSVVVDSYTGYEPATLTAAGLVRMAEFINRARGGVFEATIKCCPFEDSIEQPDTYDFAMTSPPYYDSEIYSDEPTNSLNRYKTFDEWVSGFYCPMIDKTMRQLKAGAPFVFNIGDRRWPLSEALEHHCALMGYQLKRLDADIVDSGGLGKTFGMGEKFYELRRNG